MVESPSLSAAQITPWHFFALKKGKKKVVGDGFDEEAECRKHDADEEPCETSRRRSGARHEA